MVLLSYSCGSEDSRMLRLRACGKNKGRKGPVPFFSERSLALGELEALAGALFAVFLAFLHAAIAGEIAGVAEDLGDAAGGFAVGFGRGRVAEHGLEGAGGPLANGAGLAGDAAPLDLDDHVQPVAHLRDDQRPKDGVAIL